MGDDDGDGVVDDVDVVVMVMMLLMTLLLLLMVVLLMSTLLMMMTSMISCIDDADVLITYHVGRPRQHGGGGVWETLYIWRPWHAWATNT